MDQEIIEKCLAPIWSDITYITKGKKFAIVDAMLKTVEKVHEHSLSPLQTNEVVLLLTYLQRRMSRVEVARGTDRNICCVGDSRLVVQYI